MLILFENSIIENTAAHQFNREQLNRNVNDIANLEKAHNSSVASMNSIIGGVNNSIKFGAQTRQLAISIGKHKVNLTSFSCFREKRTGCLVFVTTQDFGLRVFCIRSVPYPGWNALVV